MPVEGVEHIGVIGRDVDIFADWSTEGLRALVDSAREATGNEGHRGRGEGYRVDGLRVGSTTKPRGSRWRTLGIMVAAKRDVRAILQFLDIARSSRFHDFYEMSVLSGMRRSELAGVQWENVDLEKGTISVVKTLQRIDGHGLVEGQPKAAKSRRMIALSDRAKGTLRSVQLKQHEQRLAWGDAWQDTGYVFTSEDGKPISPERYTRGFTALVRQSGLPHLTLHGLRHCHATLLLSSGVHPKVVSERLGHANIAITLDTYSHVLPGLQEAAADALDERLASG